MEDPLRVLMGRYTVEHLAEGVDPEEFRRHIESLPKTVYGHDSHQRQSENEFYWGHDHDFGTFQMKGKQKDRHYELAQLFMGKGIEFKGRVLDVGCWTGGTSLLLAAMGCEVIGVEEVVHYAEAANYLAAAFGIQDRLRVIPGSLYDIPALSESADSMGTFDLALCAGVLYHVSDPLYALRILFELLRDGGKVLIETMISGIEGCLEYYGPQVPGLGYCWFMLSPEVLRRMMEDVGFTSVQYEGTAFIRGMAIGTRERYVSMNHAGMPRPVRFGWHSDEGDQNN